MESEFEVVDDIVYDFMIFDKSNDKYELEVFLCSGGRLEGVGYDIRVGGGKPKIIEESMDLICMLPWV